MLREEKLANKKAGIEASDTVSDSSDSESNSNFKYNKNNK